MEPFLGVRDSYAAFAHEASDSPCFVEWARGVVTDDEVSTLIATLPAVKQQPNLVFAAARWLGVPAPGPYAGLREVLVSRWDEIGSIVLSKSTQTNEVRRLATLLPAFACVANASTAPIALLEVGASAGLNLFPDRWSYRWTAVDGTDCRLGTGPELSCAIVGPVPLPTQIPEIGWRGGIDLNPLDVTDSEAMSWLTNLVWPEQDERRERLATAISIAAQDPPALRSGDLLETLPSLLEELPAGLTPIVFHSAVIAYLPPQRRTAFHAVMTDLVAQGRCHWVSNEGPNVLPELAEGVEPPTSPSFLLGVDGRPVGWTHGHGARLEWFS